jgi:hypothetical protein
MEVIQSNFSGGMNLFNQDVILGEGEYGRAFNIRNRKASLQPVRAAVEDTDIADGKKQGIYGFDNYIVAFVGGRAYYKDVVTDGDWTLIAELYLDPTVDYIYTEAVPASTFNFERKLASASQLGGTDANNPVNTTTLIINGTPSCLVVQDGINQPWIIIVTDGVVSTRKAQRYDEWTITVREYVPIMKQMQYTADGILFGIAPDGVTIYRSVSGRPLDFVINVKVDGNKGGDAATTAYSVGSNTINFIGEFGNGLIVGTKKGMILLELNYAKTIFAEPTFRRVGRVSAGIVNHFSFISYLHADGLNDYYFVDFDGMRYLNVIRDANEGRNTSFSLRVGRLPYQTTTAAVVFDDYSLFSLGTEEGNVIGVFDNTRKQWVCFDDIGDDDAIKMFAVADQTSSPKLYCITDGKLYQLYAGESYLTASVNFKASVAGRDNLKLQNANIVLTDAIANSNATVTAVVDGNEVKALIKQTTSDNVDNLYYNFQNLAKQGWKCSLKVEWSDASELVFVGSEYNLVNPQSPYRNQANY